MASLSNSIKSFDLSRLSCCSRRILYKFIRIFGRITFIQRPTHHKSEKGLILPKLGRLFSVSYLLFYEPRKGISEPTLRRLTIISQTNWNLKTTILQMVIAHHRALIKSSEMLENKGFIAMCPPYPFIRFHTGLLLRSSLIRAKTREAKSGNRL